MLRCAAGGAAVPQPSQWLAAAVCLCMATPRASRHCWACAELWIGANNMPFAVDLDNTHLFVCGVRERIWLSVVVAEGGGKGGRLGVLMMHCEEALLSKGRAV